MDTVIPKIKKWARSISDVRAIILEGSRGSNCEVDVLSDYDINVFGKNLSPLLESDSWISFFGNPLIYQKTGFTYGDWVIPTRLALYRSGLKIDFSIWPLNLLENFVSNNFLPESYRNGFKVLVDKDNVATDLSSPDQGGFEFCLPDQVRFTENLDNFWFEAYCIAKYLKRGNLHYALKLLYGPILDYFSIMMMWHKLNQEGLAKYRQFNNKRLEKYLNPEDIREWFGFRFRYEKPELWRQLFHLYRIYRETAIKAANELSIVYPEEKDKTIFEMILALKRSR